MTCIQGQFKLSTKGSIYSGKLYSNQDEITSTFSDLKSRNVTLIVNLLEEHYDYIVNIEKSQFKVIHLPINDFSIPNDIKAFGNQVKRIHNLLKVGQNIFVHCYGGHGRTGLLLACLGILDGWHIDDALFYTSRYCKGPETQEQRDFVRKFYQIVES